MIGEDGLLDSRRFQVVGALVAKEVGGWHVTVRTVSADPTYLRAERLPNYATNVLSPKQLGEVLTVVRDLYASEDAVAEIGDPRFAWADAHVSDRAIELRVPASHRERVFLRLVAILEQTQPRF